MLRTVETLLGLKLKAEDGEIGEISDLYFGDQTWRVRHFVAETGRWLQDKRVLINPRRIVGLKPEQGSIEADVTMAEVEVCPPAVSSWMRATGPSAIWRWTLAVCRPASTC